MDRIYTNRRHSERRIHIEIDENEIANLLNDLDPANANAFHATKHLVELLQAAHASFGNSRQPNARQAETRQT